jgi:putative addiction module component (TIGR02574 family)
VEVLEKNELIKSILSMPPVDRIEIIDTILNDFNSKNDFEKEWVAESEKRVDGYLNGSIKAIPIDDVFNKINSFK